MRWTLLLMLVITLFGCQQQTGPSAKDIFDLRSKCGAFADKWAKDIPVGEWGAHYDPKSNRCFLENNVGGKDVSLYDPQSHKLLASCTGRGNSPRRIRARCAAAPMSRALLRIEVAQPLAGRV